MNGVWPIGRTASAYGSALLTFVLASACAAGAACAHGATPAPQSGLVESAELTRLQTQLAERDQTIEQLEGRMAMLEASERALHERLEAASARARFEVEEAAPARESVRIGRAQQKAPEPSEPRPVLSNNSEPRPVLRLEGHASERRDGDRRESERRELTSSSWTPPVTSERLTVMPVPALGARASSTPPLASETLALQPRPAVMLVSAAPAGAAAAASNGPADELYVHALDLLRRREFPEALRELDAFLHGYAADPRFARAQFFRGEILYAQRDFARALAAFEASLVREPRGDKAPDTLLRIARCQTQLGAHERARAALNKLKANFPQSEAARVAEHVTQEDT